MNKEIIYLDSDSDETDRTQDKRIETVQSMSRLAAFSSLVIQGAPFQSVSEDTLALFNARDVDALVTEMRLRVNHLPRSNPLPLTSGQLYQIGHYLMNRENFKPGLVVLSRKNIHIESIGFARLIDSKTWLDETLPNAIGHLLVEKNRPVAYLDTYFWALDTTFASRILERVFNASHLSHCEILFTPLNTGSHWVLLVVKLRTGELNFYDSYHLTWRSYEEKCPHLKTCLALLVTKLRAFFPTQRWSTVSSIESYPTQWDISSCGLYVMHAMECITYDVTKDEFAQETWDERSFFLRLHYALCILNGSLREETDGEMSDDILV